MDIRSKCDRSCRALPHHETIALLKQLTPQVKTVVFMARGNEPSTRGTFNQIRAEMEQYPFKKWSGSGSRIPMKRL